MSLHIETPLIEMLDFSNNERSVKLKMEAYQPTGSFKLRGIGNLCTDAINNGKKHLICASSGNAGLAVAYAGRKYGVKVTVVISETTPKIAIETIENAGANVVVHGEVWDDSHKHGLFLAEQEDDAIYIHPFDHPKVWEGHASMIDELKEQCDEQPDIIILSVGGGGLFCGVVEGLIRNQWTDTHVLAVETEGAGSLYHSVKENKHVYLNELNTIAQSLANKQVVYKAFDYANKYNVIPYLVSDESSARSCVRFLDDYRSMVQPACGASVSVVYDNAEILKEYKNIVVVACGGSIISMQKINDWKEKYKI